MTILDSWTQGEHTWEGTSHPTYRKGSGPGVVVIHEIPGPTPSVIGFGQELVDAGYTVVLPHLFGKAGGAWNGVNVARAMAQVCISSEFTKLATGVTTPIAGCCARSPATCTPSSADPASARSACASPAGSRWR